MDIRIIRTMSSLPTDKPSSGKMLEQSQSANRPERFKQGYPTDSRNDGQEQGNLTHEGTLSILGNTLNKKSHDSKEQITDQ